MTYRQECLCYCIDHLESNSFDGVFNLEIFNRVFNQNNYPSANPYFVGIAAADEMILNAKPIVENESASDRGYNEAA